MASWTPVPHPPWSGNSSLSDLLPAPVRSVLLLRGTHIQVSAVSREPQLPISRVDLPRSAQRFALSSAPSKVFPSRHVGTRRQWQPRGCSEEDAKAAVEEVRGVPRGRGVHFVGIGGAGLSALALVALKQGWRVSGSDLKDSRRLDALRAAGATVLIGHAAEHIARLRSSGAMDALVVSSAVRPGNAEVEAARQLSIPVYKRDQWLGHITEGFDLIAVAGTHGKSTTSAMLALALHSLGDDVTAVVGAEVPQFPDAGNALVGRSSLFVLEADEYDGCFLGLSPTLAVVTSVEWEHVDVYPSEGAVRRAFREFVHRIRPGGVLVTCGDSAGSKSLATAFQRETAGGPSDEGGAPGPRTAARRLDPADGRQVVTYGLSEGNDWRAVMLSPNPQGGTDYVAVHRGAPMARVHLRVAGVHNVLNSLAVVVVACQLATREAVAGGGTAAAAAGVERLRQVAAAAARSLGEFQGVRRRFELVGKARGCEVYDDYAHHPTEVRATLQAARQRFDQRPLWVVFQPHMYSRLAKLLPDFAPAFSAADRVVVTEIYAAREENAWGISGGDLADAITGPPVQYIPKQEAVIERLAWEIIAYESNGLSPRGPIVLLTLGAGDITELGPRLLSTLADAAAP